MAKAPVSESENSLFSLESNRVSAAAVADEDAGSMRVTDGGSDHEGEMSSMDRFLEKTKLHHVFGKNKSACTRVFWAVVLLFVLLLVVLSIWGHFAYFFSFPIGTMFLDVKTREVSFPLVHFHNLNQVRYVRTDVLMHKLRSLWLMQCD
jgi:hypothetical protein